MPLAAGQTLSHYEILGSLGAGGMGEVYRARDTRLEREVAIKILPEHFAEDEERLRRFEREARTLASLNHPNVAGIHGIDQVGDTCFLAMELVPGEDLAARLARGPLPVDEAVDVCRKIAEGLEAAHEAGVVHRDLKPANVRITPEGEVKLLDFGLAKPIHPKATKDGTTTAEPDSFLVTEEGLVLGTPTYMSPEQARGKPVDRRTDIWAFGCVLYECLTGRRVFDGETVSDVIAAVLGGEPDWSAVPPSTPPHVRSLLHRCLDRNPRRRLRDVGEARIALEGGELEPLVTSHRAWWSLVLVGVLGLVVGGLLPRTVATNEGSTGGAREGGEPRRTRRALLAMEGEPFRIWKHGLAVAHDGTAIVHGSGSDTGGPRYLRSLDALTSTPIAGTEGYSAPAFSPDGQWFAAFDGTALVKTSLRGGESVRLCELALPGGVTWCDDGWIYFAANLWFPARVRAEGGEVEEFPFTAMFPNALPGDAGVLLTLVDPNAPSYRAESASIAHLSSDGRTTVLIQGGYSPSFVAPNHIVFMRNGGLYAVPFDLERVEVTGPAESVVPGVCTETLWGWSNYAVGGDGTLVYTPGPDLARAVPTWVDRETKAEEPLGLPAAVYNSMDLARDGERFAIQVCESLDQVRVLDVRRGTSSRLTLEGRSAAPVFSPDGDLVYFGSQRSGRFRLYRQRADGSSPAERVLTDEESDLMDAAYVFPRSVSPDGGYLVIDIITRDGLNSDVWGVHLDHSGPPEPLLATDDNEYIASLSPDGRWLLFNSTRSGNEEIYVRPFPDLARREWQISSAQGYHATWSPDGKEILYRVENRFYSVSFRTEPDFEPDAPRQIFEVEAVDTEGPSFRGSIDGKRIVLNRPVGSREDARDVVLVTGWDVELERLVPTAP